MNEYVDGEDNSESCLEVPKASLVFIHWKGLDQREEVLMC